MPPPHPPMTMFLKVLNEVHFRGTFHLFLIIDFHPFAKPLELLAINHSSSERRIIFVHQMLKFSPCFGCFITCMGAHFPIVELDNVIQFSTLSRLSGFLQHSSKYAYWFSIFLQYTSGLEGLARSLDTDLNYVTTMLQLCPSLNH